MCVSLYLLIQLPILLQMPAPADLDRQAVALIEQSCRRCHNPEVSNSDLQLTSLNGALRGGKSGPALVPGDARASLMYRLVEAGEMPFLEPLPAAQRELLRLWIDSGAGWPDPALPEMPSDAIHSAIDDMPRRPVSPIHPGRPVDFEKDIFPIFEQRCHSCHGSGLQQAELRLDNRKVVFQGGISGPAVLPGDSAASLLFRRVTGTLEPRMPPVGDSLTDEEAGLIQAWIDQGASWPEHVGVGDGVEVHWAFTRPPKPELPTVGDDRWSRNPIDRFIRSRQRERGLQAVSQADPRTLVRRAYYGLVGLPPSAEAIDGFQEFSRDAWEELIDGLLDSPHYGERWARHWLDVARYSESIGFEFDRYYPWAFQYRDFVIRAFNQNMPYDKFLRWQVAGDEYAPGDPDALAATGFGAVGPFQANEPTELERFDALDDILGATTQAMLGLTVACARCHNHKYDPIAQKDYYQLLAFFKGTQRVNHSLPSSSEPSAELTTARAERDTWLAARTEEWRRRRLADQGALAASHDQILGALQNRDTLELIPDSVSTSHFAENPQALFDREPIRDSNDHDVERFLWISGFADTDWVQYNFSEPREIDYSRVYWFDDTPRAGTIRAPQAYTILYRADGEWKPVELQGSTYTTAKDRFNEVRFKPVTTRHLRLRVQPPEGSSGGIHEWAVGRFSPTANEALRLAETLRLDGTRNLQTQLQEFLSHNEREHWQGLKTRVTRLEEQQEFAFGLREASFEPPQTFLLGRGSPAQRVQEVEPAFPSILVRPGVSPGKWFELEPSADAGTSFRRRALGQWLTDAGDGAGLLAARVFVNRVWSHHMSAPLVPSVDNFGKAGLPPTHPDLLDWLAHDFIEHGWNVQRLHKMILTSETYQLSSRSSATQTAIDPENRWYWRRQPRRIEAEILRDSILAVSGKLNPQMFGPSIRPRIHPDALAHATNPRVAKWPADIVDDARTWRRSVYIRQRRSLIMPFLETFDGPDGHISVGSRETTVIPTQSLYLLNSAFVREHSLYLAQRVRREAGNTPEERAALIFRVALGRRPTSQEKQAAVAFLTAQEASYSTREEGTLARLHAIQDLCQAVISQDEFIYID